MTTENETSTVAELRSDTGSTVMDKQMMVKWQLDSTAEAKVSERDKLILLAELAVNGGRSELVALCEAITRDVFFRVMRYIPNIMDAEDVSQNILVRVCENISGLKKPPAFGNWLSAIIKNEINRFRGKRAIRNPAVDIDEYIATEAHATLIEDDVEFLPSEYVIRQEERKVVMSLVDKLPERQLEAILLHYFEGLSISETAQQMAVTQPAVSRYLSLAKKKVKTELHRYSEKTGGKHYMASIATGALIMQVMHNEAALLPGVSKVFIEQAVNAGLAKGASSKAAYLMSTTNMRDLAIGAALVLSACAVVFCCWVGSQVFETVRNSQTVAAVTTTGEILFTDINMNTTTINPTQAKVWASNGRGDLTALSWWITKKSSNSIIHSGEGGDVNDALAGMCEAGEFGEYTLFLSMEDAEGATYTLQRQFWIVG